MDFVVVHTCSDATFCYNTVNYIARLCDFWESYHQASQICYNVIFYSLHISVDIIIAISNGLHGRKARTLIIYMSKIFMSISAFEDHSATYSNTT